MTYDLVIKNGTVVDGSGLAGYRSDIAVQDDVIVAIGRIHERGKQEIDAEGHVITPGFIDGHTHMDAQVFWDSQGTCSCWHGVTTVVMGHCGFTLAPASYEQSHLVVRILERAEDISGSAMAAGIDWSWTTFAEYLDAVGRLPKGINYASNIGHSALRSYVMGERAFSERATEQDLRAMELELRAALNAGAYGLTTSQSQSHETTDNRPVPSRLADWGELQQLVRAMGELGAGIFQITQASPAANEPEVFSDRIRLLAVETGIPVAVIVTGTRDGLKALELIDSTAAAGGQMFGLTHCRGIGSMSSFRTQLPFDSLPEWRTVRALPLHLQRSALEDPDVKARLIREAHDGRYGRAIGAEARKPDFDQMRVLDSPLPPNPTVAEAARARGVDPVELIIDLALETDFSQFFVQTFHPFDSLVVKRVLKHPRTVMTFSDAGAHVSQMSDCSIQTHLLAHWVRGRQDFTLEEAVRMLTLAPARAWGFHNRGLLREGLIADINVFDAETVGPDMPTVVHDLPAGEKRIKQTASGFLATIVSGKIVHLRNEHTGALPGKLIRGPLGRMSRES